jgi:hypothetical protein
VFLNLPQRTLNLPSVRSLTHALPATVHSCLFCFVLIYLDVYAHACPSLQRQAFCRLCAVFGGTYMLRQRIGGFVTASDDETESKRCCGVTIGGEVFEAKWVVTTSACLPDTYPAPSAGSRVVRAVVVTDGTRPAFLCSCCSHASVRASFAALQTEIAHASKPMACAFPCFSFTRTLN